MSNTVQQATETQRPSIPPPCPSSPIPYGDVPPQLSRSRTHNYLNEVKAVSMGSQDDLNKQQQRRDSERSSFVSMSHHAYKRRCSLTNDLDCAVEYPEFPELHETFETENVRSYADELDTLESADTNQDAGNESSVSDNYSNFVAGQKGGACSFSEGIVAPRARANYGRINERFSFQSKEEPSALTAAQIEEDLKKRRLQVRRKTSTSYNEYRTEAFRRSIK